MEQTCEITEKQNQTHALKYIAAWSYLYGRAKIIAGWQFWMAVPGALAMSLIALRWPDAKIITTPIALLFGWLDILLLDPIQNDRKKIAAKTQELFDCEVFDLDWNKLRCSSKPETEILKEAGDKFLSVAKNPQHANWYPIEIARLPLPLARLVCQRAAVWWDMSQRKRYGVWLLAISLLVMAGIVAFSFTGDLRVRDMVLGVYLPFAPVVVWAVREYRRQREAANNLEKLKMQIEGVFEDAITGKHDRTSLNNISRNIQDMVFDGRSRNPLLFNCIYKRLRDKHELLMGEKANEMADRAMAVQSSWNF